MNRIVLYIRQAWTLIKQNKLYSGIYIAGTALSIALAMILVIILFIKTAPLYPEYSRDRMFVINMIRQESKDTTRFEERNAKAAYRLVEMLKDLQHKDQIAAVSSHMDYLAESEKVKTPVKCYPLMVDDGYWKVFDFEFLSGKPFEKSDICSNTSKVVVTSSFAKKMFGTDDAVGKTMLLKGVEYKVSGVVKDVAKSMSQYTSTDLWVPCVHGLLEIPDYWLIGSFSILMTVKSQEDKEMLVDEINAVMNKYNAQNKEYTYTLPYGVLSFTEDTFQVNEDGNGGMEKFIYVLLALILIPALNLSGLISSRMKGRQAEMGVRKVYGATNNILLGQILWENFILTLIGGLVGLLLCYVVTGTAGDWLVTVFDTGGKTAGATGADNLSIEMLFNWTVYGGVLLLCLVLNYVSAIIPAMVSLRKTIVNMLNQKR